MKLNELNMIIIQFKFFLNACEDRVFLEPVK